MRQFVVVFCLSVFIAEAFSLVQNPVLKNARLVQLSANERQSHSARRNNGDILKSYLKQENVFNLGDVEELKLTHSINSKLGKTVHHYEQFVEGVKVFGSMVKAVEQQGELHYVSGTAFPQTHTKVNTKPSVSLEKAQDIAVKELQRNVMWQLKRAKQSVEIQQDQILTKIVKSELVIHNPALVRGKSEESALCYMVSVATANNDFHKNIFVNAHNGQVMDSFDAKPSALVRELYQYNETNLIWNEGDSRPPLGQARLDIYLKAMQYIYQLYNNTYGRDGYDNRGQAFRAVDDGLADFNAYFDDTKNITVYNSILGVLDVIAHEFQHAYTAYSDGLIYYIQFGALNEAYSDIIGNTVELLFETDPTKIASNSIIRTDDACSTISKVSANFSSSTADDLVLTVGGDSSVPPLNQNLIAVRPPESIFCNWDGVYDFAGKVALVQRGNCSFATKVQNAIDAGASGVIIVNNVAGVFAPSINFTSNIWFGMVTYDPILFDAVSGDEFTVTFAQISAITNSTRWLVGEDSIAIRDMWNPPCFENPDSTESPIYFCDLTSDSGGVHINSGVPNKMYALLVDGGSFGGVTVPAIGLEKAFYIYSTAQFLFQDSFSDFPHHAAALRAACTDLIGAEIYDMKTGAVSVNTISQSDCNAVETAMDAVQLEKYPGACPVDYEPEPATAACTGSTSVIYATNFTRVPSGWSSTSSDIFDTTSFFARDWGFESGDLLVGRVGGLFGPANFPFCGQAGEVNLITSVFTNAAVDGDVIVEFDHLPLFEDFYDGGLVEVNVNNAGWVYVQNFTLNGYDDVLATQFKNPNEGKAAYTRSLLGYQGRPIFRTTRFNVNLKPGDTFQVKLVISTDDCGGYLGWILDSFKVYACGDYNVSTSGSNTGASTSGNASSSSTTGDKESSATTIFASITLMIASLFALLL